jgi:putative hydrolase of the HAD superfamily
VIVWFESWNLELGTWNFWTRLPVQVGLDAAVAIPYTVSTARAGRTLMPRPPSLPRFRAALFDAGLTLIHPTRSVESIYAAFGARQGRPVEPFLPQIQVTFRELFEAERQAMADGHDGYVASDAADHAVWRRICFAVAERIPGLTDDPQAWFEALYDHFGRAETWQLYPDAVPTLAALADRGVQLAVVSNWDSRLLGILQALEVTPLVHTVAVSAVEGVRKPGPRIFEQTLDRLGVAPEDAIMVGDSLVDDVGGARAAGVTGVLIQRDRAPAPAPDGVPAIHSLSELLD